MKLADIKYQVAMTAAFVLSGGQFTDIATHRHGAVAACSGLLQQQHVQQIIPPPPLGPTQPPIYWVPCLFARDKEVRA